MSAENKQKVTVKHTLAGLTITALSSALALAGFEQYQGATFLLIMGIIFGALYFVKEFPYWLQKVMDVVVFYNSIKPIAEIIKKESPKLDTSRQEISKALELINKEMNKENPELVMKNGSE